MIVKRGLKVLSEKYSELPPRLSACGGWLFEHYHLTNKPRGVLIANQGYNDSDYLCNPIIDGTHYMCPIYQIWVSMLKRTQVGGKFQQKYPTYVDTKVAEVWLSFLAFKNWIESVNLQFRKELNIAADDSTSVWTNKQLDKDLLAGGNKLYSAETCLFVTQKVNSFMLDRGAARGDLPIGVHFHKASGKYQVSCSNPLTGKREHLGLFTHDQLDLAVYTYKLRKYELAHQLADQLSLSAFSHDRIAAECLRELYPLPTPPTK
jgi:hypothetical protein